jgi:hypothetical protein
LALLQPTQAGLYQVLVMNNSGFVASSNANLTVRIPANITQHPQSQSIRAGSNVTFTVSASSSTPISYQWFFNGAPIPGATSPFLTINGVTNVNEGTYLVQVADAVGPIFSSPAFLRVLITPYLQSPAPPLNISAVVGEPLTLGVQYVGTLPVWTRWRLFRASGGGTILVDQTNSASSSFYSFVVNTNSAGAYTVILTNVAGGSQSFAWTNAILTVLTDSNTNGIPDVWEATYFGSPTGVTNRDADSDGDGLSNWEEYRAGTDPTDPTSYLKVTRISPAGGARIEFNAVSNRTYSVEFKDGIDTALWTRLVDVLARGTNWAAAVVDPSPGTNRYYHLVTPKQP